MKLVQIATFVASSSRQADRLASALSPINEGFTPLICVKTDAQKTLEVAEKRSKEARKALEKAAKKRAERIRRAEQMFHVKHSMMAGGSI